MARAAQPAAGGALPVTAEAGEASSRRATTERTRDMPVHQPWRGNFVNSHPGAGCRRTGTQVTEQPAKSWESFVKSGTVGDLLGSRSCVERHRLSKRRQRINR